MNDFRISLEQNIDMDLATIPERIKDNGDILDPKYEEERVAAQELPSI